MSKAGSLQKNKNKNKNKEIPFPCFIFPQRTNWRGFCRSEVNLAIMCVAENIIILKQRAEAKPSEGQTGEQGDHKKPTIVLC